MDLRKFGITLGLMYFSIVAWVLLR
jgi:hypothetical protein